jgi:hypothetical protein
MVVRQIILVLAVAVLVLLVEIQHLQQVEPEVQELHLVLAVHLLLMLVAVVVELISVEQAVLVVLAVVEQALHLQTEQRELLTQAAASRSQAIRRLYQSDVPYGPGAASNRRSKKRPEWYFRS